MPESVKAIVEKVVPEGPHGAYVIATAKELEGSVTFSLKRKVWQEREHPEPGEVVYLTKLVLKRLGWRANEGRYWTPSDEQTAEERVMRRLRVLFDQLKSRWFPTEDDTAWRRWVDHKRRETGDLFELLSANVRDSLKRRALFLLLVPTAELNPIYWDKEVGKFYHRLDFLKSLSPKLLEHVSELLVEFITILGPQHNDRPRNVVGGGGDITVYMSIPDKYHSALTTYNSCILMLLPLLPERQAERLFSLFSLRDISTYWNMDEASGYTPFEHLLRAPEIDLRWKMAADSAMRGIVKDELSGDKQAREKWEDALGCYISITEMQLHGELKYPLEMYADQLQFIMDNRIPGAHLIDGFNVARIFELLADDTYKDLRHQISRTVILDHKDDYGRFSVYSDTRQAADQMLAEFGESDPELAERLETLITEGKERQADHTTHQEEARRTEGSILDQMR